MSACSGSSAPSSSKVSRSTSSCSSARPRSLSAWGSARLCCASAAFARCGALGTLHVEIFRNAPDYVMIVWVHFVLPLLIGTMLHTRLELNPFASGVIALGLVYSGYFAETFRAGIEAVPSGHVEAARSLGMGEQLVLWRIVLPQVVRRMLPESINVFISLFKATTIVSLIAVPDLMYRVSMITQQEMRPLPLYTGPRSCTSRSCSWPVPRCARSPNVGGQRSYEGRAVNNWERLVWNQREALLAGLQVTLEVCLISFAAAIVVGMALCLVRMYVKPLRAPAIVLIEFFRATRSSCSSCGSTTCGRSSSAGPIRSSRRLHGLAVQSSGYLAETFRAGIEAIPKGHREAAYSVGCRTR
jgi:ABC-type amino acid transport system permease subunit